MRMEQADNLWPNEFYIENEKKWLIKNVSSTMNYM